MISNVCVCKSLLVLDKRLLKRVATCVVSKEEEEEEEIKTCL